MPDTPTVADVLDRAADIIQFEGWCQHEYVHRGPDGQPTAYCMKGGIMAAAERLDPKCKRFFERGWAAAEAAATYLATDADSIPEWNDHPDRTAEDVIDALRGCAKAQRETEQVGR